MWTLRRGYQELEIRHKPVASPTPLELTNFLLKNIREEVRKEAVHFTVTSLPLLNKGLPTQPTLMIAGDGKQRCEASASMKASLDMARSDPGAPSDH